MDKRLVWVLPLLLVGAVPNAYLLWESFGMILGYDGPVLDFWIMGEALTRPMYDWGPGEPFDYSYRYSPLLPYVMSPFVALGLDVWRALHLVALAALPWKVIPLVLLFGPFWYDVAYANVLTFVAVLGWHALQGKRWAVVGYFVLFALVPRPLMVPLAVWLVWKQPEARRWAAGVAAVGLVLTAATGELLPWVGAVLRGEDMMGSAFDVGPSRWLGWWWLALGVPLGGWLTWKGRVGLAGLAVSPYVLPYYGMILLWELRNAVPGAGPAERRPDDTVAAGKRAALR